MAVSNISNSNFRFAPITLNRDINREQRQPANVSNQISRIDREITARENFVNSNNRVVSTTENLINARQNLVNTNRESIATTEQLIASNNKIIELSKEHIQTLQESRDLTKKMIDLNDEGIKRIDETNVKLEELTNRTNTKIRSLLERVRGKSHESKPVAQPESTSQSKRASSIDKGNKIGTSVADKNKSVNYKLPDLNEKTYKTSVLDTAFIAESKEDNAVTALKDRQRISSPKTAGYNELRKLDNIIKNDKDSLTRPKLETISDELVKRSIAKYASIGTQTDNVPAKKAPKQTVATSEIGTQTEITTAARRDGLKASYASATRNNRFKPENREISTQDRASRSEALLRMVQSSQRNLYDSIIASKVSKLI
jgi:hypothetical protein